VYLADIADFQGMNTEYRTFFPAEPPARTTVAVSGLVSNARIEVTCLALAGRP
jgi:enamine deaminase RidA (YjgF/YER057c/UK114 family)